MLVVVGDIFYLNSQTNLRNSLDIDKRSAEVVENLRLKSLMQT